MNINLTLFAQAATFFVFIWFTAKFVWPHLSCALIEARQKHIAEGLAAAERGKQDLEKAAVRSAEMLREARQQAQEILAQAEKRGSDHRGGESAAGGKARGSLRAKAEIEQEVSRARETLRTQVAALAVAGAEKILRREVDAKAHADLLSDVQKRALDIMAEPVTSRTTLRGSRFKLALEGESLTQWADMLALIEAVVERRAGRSRIGDPNGRRARAPESLIRARLGERLDGHGS